MTERHRSFEILLAIAASIVVIAGVKFAEAIVVPFLLAIFIATIAATPVRWLHQHKVPNGIGISIVVIVFVMRSRGYWGSNNPNHSRILRTTSVLRKTIGRNYSRLVRVFAGPWNQLQQRGTSRFCRP